MALPLAGRWLAATVLLLPLTVCASAPSNPGLGPLVDVGLRALDGGETPLPTTHDDFSPRAHRDAMDLPPAGIAGRERLEQAMTGAGWIPLSTELWHFDAPGWERHSLRDEPLTTATSAD